MTDIAVKLHDLRRRFRDLGSAVVAFSGGVDSAVLAKVGHEELGNNMVAVTACSPSIPASDLASAKGICARHGIPYEVVDTDEFDNPTFRANPADRCYYCKSALYKRLMRVADERSYAVVIEGTNVSDLAGHRPGYRASCERDRVVTPLIDCGISKDEVRAIASELGLNEVAEKPATACLSSRVPTGMTLNPDTLQRIDRAEEVLKALGIRKVRVRHHGDLARIEVDGDDIAIAIRYRDRISSELQILGYRYITLDLKGYRPATPNGSA